MIIRVVFLLTLSNRHWGVSSEYELARLRRLDEKAVASHIIQVIGLSMSNETVANGYFMACNLLHRYGYTTRHPAEQRGSVCFLKRVEKDVGWRTTWMVRHLWKINGASFLSWTRALDLRFYVGNVFTIEAWLHGSFGTCYLFCVYLSI
ncbi:hypothetical protein BDV33DRAFT_131979 [Aspergillus novoparasiticus]|uniref:Transcription factor domain-containing protein n=1 Tax=Aspergillus novoparasiticus TaxID=986946 RepID=A0A5N6EJY9_9EURO|nr:hypothetical protein BDV33DRAFT_131979 [Aspergillus novoparasiticus]